MPFWKWKSSVSATQGNAETLLVASRKREQIYRDFSDGLLTHLRDFAIKVAELETDQFYGSIDRLKVDLPERVANNTSARLLGKETKFIPGFIHEQQEYLRELDTELRNIVNILTKAVVEMSSQSDTYNSTMLEQIEVVAELSRLEDIRRLKSRLSAEIGFMREIVEKKQEGEKSNIQSLAGQVEVLRSELEQVQKESRRDGLTGVFNRRAFDWFLGGLVNARSSQLQTFSLLILDLDDFKEINDNHGHLVGDRVLLGVVAICRSVIRSEDFFARYGGDEFVVIFPGAPARVAARKAKKICRLVSETRFTTEDADRPLALSLSVSLGVTASKARDTSDSIVKRADMALYDAKKAGRNCVCVG
jgi:diguanylate cyclase